MVRAREHRNGHSENGSVDAILIVEDHVVLGIGLKGYLASLGYKTELADSVAAALASAKRTLFDLYLIDLNLPDGTGWDLLRQLSTKQPIRAIAMSGWGSDSDLAKSKTVGFMEHLVKPMTPDILTTAIEDVLGRKLPIRKAQRKKST